MVVPFLPAAGTASSFDGRLIDGDQVEAGHLGDVGPAIQPGVPACSALDALALLFAKLCTSVIPLAPDAAHRCGLGSTLLAKRACLFCSYSCTGTQQVASVIQHFSSKSVDGCRLLREAEVLFLTCLTCKRFLLARRECAFVFDTTHLLEVFSVQRIESSWKSAFFRSVFFQ